MSTLHVLWLPAPPDNVSGGFFLWGEDGRRLAACPTAGRFPRFDPSDPRAHPYTVEAGALSNLGARHVATLQLPTNRRVPFPSPQVPTGAVPEGLLGPPDRVQPWFVEGVLVPTAEFLTIMAEGTLAVSETSRPYRTAARLALEMADQRMKAELKEGSRRQHC